MVIAIVKNNIMKMQEKRSNTPGPEFKLLLLMLLPTRSFQKNG